MYECMYLVKSCPATVVPDAYISVVAKKGLAARSVITHNGSMIERSQALNVPVVR